MTVHLKVRTALRSKFLWLIFLVRPKNQSLSSKLFLVMAITNSRGYVHCLIKNFKSGKKVSLFSYITKANWINIRFLLYFPYFGLTIHKRTNFVDTNAPRANISPFLRRELAYTVYDKFSWKFSLISLSFSPLLRWVSSFFCA